MIYCEAIPEPKDFYAKATEPGGRWLAKNPFPKRPKDCWSPFKPQLADGFRNLCAYSAMYEPVGTVDHFLSCGLAETRHLAYQWDNLRFAAPWLNSSKQNADDKILDPFDVEDGWFEIQLPSLQLVVTDKVPISLRAKAHYTIEQLHLVDDERVVRQRRAWYQMYEAGHIKLAGLERVAPLIARAVRKQEAHNGK